MLRQLQTSATAAAEAAAPTVAAFLERALPTVGAARLAEYAAALDAVGCSTWLDLHDVLVTDDIVVRTSARARVRARARGFAHSRVLL